MQDCQSARLPDCQKARMPDRWKKRKIDYDSLAILQSCYLAIWPYVSSFIPGAILFNASIYLSVVFLMISSGNLGAGGFLSHLMDSR